MKKKNKAVLPTTQSAGTPVSARANGFDYLFPLLPLGVLVPNFFIMPSLNHPGLVTQEVVFAAAVLLCAVIGLALSWRTLSSDENVFCARNTRWLFAPLVLFVLWQTLSLTWAVERGEALRVLGCWFGFLIFTAAAWGRLRTRTAWWIYSFLLVVAVTLAFSQWLEYRNFGSTNMLGVFFNHGLTAELLTTVFPLFFCVFLFEKHNRLAISAAVLAMFFTLGALMLTLRRGPLLGLVVSVAFIFLSLMAGKMLGAIRPRVIIIVFSLIVFLVPLAIVKREAIMTRLLTATELRAASGGEAADLGLTNRAVMWLTAVEMGKKHWLKGVGTGNYAAHYAQFRRYFIENPRYARVVAAAETEDFDFVRNPFAHSEYLQIFAELGVIGVVLFLIFWAAVLRSLWQARHARLGYLAFAAVAGLLAFGVSSAISGFSFRLTPGIFIVASMLALGWAVREPANAEPNEEPNDQAFSFSLPRNAVIGLWAVGVLASLLLLARSYNVYASQRAQGSMTMEAQLDFSFALDNAPVNEASVRRYQRILAGDPYNAGAHLGLAVLLFQMKRLPECLPYAEYASLHGFNRPFTYLLRAFALEHSDAPDRAETLLREGIAIYPKSVILRTAYAEMLRKRGHPEEVQNQWSELEKRGIDLKYARSWTLAMRYQNDAAAKLAQRDGLTPPGELKPTLARVLAQARAYHYFRAIEPAPASP